MMNRHNRLCGIRKACHQAETFPGSLSLYESQDVVKHPFCPQANRRHWPPIRKGAGPEEHFKLPTIAKLRPRPP